MRCGDSEHPGSSSEQSASGSDSHGNMPTISHRARHSSGLLAARLGQVTATCAPAVAVGGPAMMACGLSVDSPIRLDVSHRRRCASVCIERESANGREVMRPASKPSSVVLGRPPQFIAGAGNYLDRATARSVYQRVRRDERCLGSASGNSPTFAAVSAPNAATRWRRA